MKRNLLIGSLLLSVSQLAQAQLEHITPKLEQIEQQLGGKISVTIYNANNNQTWDHHGKHQVPMMSTFKTLACANLLYQADQKKIDLHQPITIKQVDILDYAPITKNHIGRTMTLNELCSATMLTSDNTAANLVLKHIGGPQAITQFMRTLNDTTTRLDRIEPDLNNVSATEVRDTTTANAMTKSLYTLLYSTTLHPHSAAQLKQWMITNKVSDPLLRSVLPHGWHIADRSGYDSNYGSRAITAAVWKDNQQPIIISIYLSQTQQPIQKLNQTIAEIGQLIFNNL